MRGDGQKKISGVASLARAQPSDLAFFYNKAMIDALQETKAGAVILMAEHAGLYAGPALLTDKPRLAFAKVAVLFERRADGRDARA